MNEVLLAQILRNVSLGISLIGILVGLDLVLGAKAILTAKRFFDRAYNFDQVITKPRTRMLLGIIILLVSLVMLFLLMATR